MWLEDSGLLFRAFRTKVVRLCLRAICSKAFAKHPCFYSCYSKMVDKNGQSF